MNTIVGIDLGTTNSGVSIVRDGKPQMLPNKDERIIPSVVGYVPGDDKWLVGTPARNQYVLHPKNTVRSIKREMGTDTRVNLSGREFSPQEISAFVLRELKVIAERNLGHDVSDAVITVPAFFTDAARQATHDAGEIAGFNVRRIINEPTAAALAYGLNKDDDQIVLVYDLGGGTFDVSLVELMGGIVEVRASHGNTRLGGDDIDLLLAEKIADWFEDQNGVDLRPDHRAWARLLRAAEAAKIQLSSHPFAWIKEEYLLEKKGVPLHLEYEVSRDELEEAIGSMLDQTLDSVKRVMEDAQVTSEEITQVFMVGGSTYIPAVWDSVANYLDMEPHMSINPEEAVALGAGVQAAIIAGEPIDAILVDVTPYSLGIEVAQILLGRIIPDRYKVLIRRNTTIPVTKEDIFYTLYPDQDTINVKVYQGESPIASENKLLDEFLISDLEPENPGEQAKVTVQFDFDVNGILKVTARDRYTGKQEMVTVSATSARLSQAELQDATTWMDETMTEQPDTLSAERTILLEKAKKLAAGDTLSVEERDDLETLLLEIENTQAERDATLLDELMEELLDTLFDLDE